MLAAFARGGLLRFGLRTLARGPAVVVQLLALLLVPWTALLAATPAAHWFPSPAVKWAWVGFDVALAAGLIALTVRWRAGLARLLAVAIGADALVTAVEAVAWNVPRASGVGEGLAIAAAVFAPAFAFALLWRAVRRRHG